MIFLDGDFLSILPQDAEPSVCTVCGEPKTKHIRGHTVPVMCACERKEYEAAERRRRQASFLMMLRGRWDEDGMCISGFQRHTFASDESTGNAKDTMDVCRRYANHWEKMRENGTGMLLYGPVGTGKSFAAHSVANELITKGVTVCVTTLPRLLDLIGQRRDVVGRLRYYDLLVIDDLGTERGTSYAEEQTYNIIDARYSSGLPLIVTTNLDQKTIKESQNRVYDRITEMCPIVLRFDGTSRRIKIAEKARKEAAKILTGGTNG